MVEDGFFQSMSVIYFDVSNANCERKIALSMVNTNICFSATWVSVSHRYLTLAHDSNCPKQRYKIFPLGNRRNVEVGSQVKWYQLL